MEEYAAVWRPELLYTNKEVNLLTHEVNMEARLMVVRNETAAYRLGGHKSPTKCFEKPNW
jgi:hypothetical protein